VIDDPEVVVGRWAVTPSGERFVAKACRAGTVHVVRWWEVWCDGELLDVYDEPSLARGYVECMNARRETLA
jgi:hypothetical protein